MYRRKVFLAMLLSLSACSSKEKPASKIKVEMHAGYLSCYALEPNVKKQCTDALAAKYVDQRLHQVPGYVQAFQFEMEKLGFKDFLNRHNLPCATIQEGPEFINNKDAYLVTCEPKAQYLMQFDYKTKQWKLLEVNNNKRYKKLLE